MVLCVAAFADGAAALAQEPKPDAAPTGRAPRPDPAPSAVRRPQAPAASTSTPVATATPTAAAAAATPAGTVTAVRRRPPQSSSEPRRHARSRSAADRRVQRRSRRTVDAPAPARRPFESVVSPRVDRPVADERGRRATGTIKLGALALLVLVALNFAALRLTLARMRHEALP